MKMTATSSVFNFGLVLSLVCLGTVFVGGWYFQSSLVGLQAQMMTKIEVQAEMIQQLKETVMEQSKQLMYQNKQLIVLQLQLNSNQQHTQVSEL